MTNVCVDNFWQLIQDSLSVRIVFPRILIGAPGAGVHHQLLARQLLVIGQLAGFRHEALCPGAGGALLLPRGEVPGGLHGDRVLDPLDHLGLGHEVDLGMVGENLINPVEESIKELGSVLQP